MTYVIKVCPSTTIMFSRVLKLVQLADRGNFSLIRQLRISAACLVKGTEVRMPSLSPTMTEGTIIKWHKKEGDKIDPGDVICEIQTDKAIVAFEIEDEAVLAKILVPEDVKDVKVGSLIAMFVEEGQDWKDVEIPTETSPPTAAGSTEAKLPPKAPVSSSSPSIDHTSSGGKVRLQSPTARNLLHHFGIDVSSLSASGPKDTLLKEDVLNYIKQNNLKPKSESDPGDAKSTQVRTKAKTKYTDIELTNMRKIIAKRLTLSKTTIPHSYMTVECNMDEVSRMRQELKARNVKVSVNDFIIKAAAVSLYQCPAVNVRWNELSETIEAVRGVDISIAVATPNGLITPIIKDADSLSVEGIAKAVKELSTKARDGKLQPHEFQGGSFSISNLGMFGIKEFSAVINPPQAAILAVGRGVPTLNESGHVNELMRGTLSYDSRVVDEEIAAEFMETFSKLLSNPRLLEGSPESDGKRLSALLIS